MCSVAVYLVVLMTVFGENLANWGQYSQRTDELPFQPLLVRDGEDITINHMVTLLRCKHQICRLQGNPLENQMNTAVEEQNILKELLDGTVFNVSADVKIESRGSFDAAKSVQLCDTEGPLTLQPHLMRNTRDEWKLILNTKRFQQIFTIEFCRDLIGGIEQRSRKNQYCTDLDFHCSQNYQELSLVTYDEKKNNIALDNFIIPTTCVCSCSSTIF